jgi:hypothetical protein
MSSLPENNNGGNGAVPGKPTSCPHCFSEEVAPDPFTGDEMCMQCGALVTENRLVAEIGFSESGGKKSVIGQSVNWGTGASVVTGGGFNRESREITMKNAKRHIDSIAQKLKINVQMQNSAHRIFGLAVDRSFNKVRNDDIRIFGLAVDSSFNKVSIVDWGMLLQKIFCLSLH